MLGIARGATTFTEVPDAPSASSGVPRGSAASNADAGTASPHGATTQTVTVASPETASAPSVSFHNPTQGFLSGPALPQLDAPPQLLPVSGVVTELQGSTSVPRGGEAPSFGGSEIARGGESLATISLASSADSDHGWFIVPSAANEYGQAYAASDGFTWDVAAGEFAVDFFFV